MDKEEPRTEDEQQRLSKKCKKVKAEAEVDLKHFELFLTHVVRLGHLSDNFEDGSAPARDWLNEVISELKKLEKLFNDEEVIKEGKAIWVKIHKGPTSYQPTAAERSIDALGQFEAGRPAHLAELFLTDMDNLLERNSIMGSHKATFLDKSFGSFTLPSLSRSPSSNLRISLSHRIARLYNLDHDAWEKRHQLSRATSRVW